MKKHLVCWLVVLGCHFKSKGHIMEVIEAHVLPRFLTPVNTQLSFQSHQLLFSHASTEKKVCPNQVLNSQSPGHESNMLATQAGKQFSDSLQ